MTELGVKFSRCTTDELVGVLKAHLPHSNALYNRIVAPQNTPDRHCLVASSFGGVSAVPEVFTIVFSDRSRKAESQIWIYNSLQNVDRVPVLETQHHSELQIHAHALLLYLRNTKIPNAPGWPFEPLLRFAMVHERVFNALEPYVLKGMEYKSSWKQFLIDTSALPAVLSEAALPKGFTISRVPDDQLDVVLSTSTIPRQASTIKALPSAALLDADGKLISWAYIGIDGSFATLYTLPDYRGRGLGTFVVTQLLKQLDQGQYSDLRFHGSTHWTQADVSKDNAQSQRVMMKLGGQTHWNTAYLRINIDKLDL